MRSAIGVLGVVCVLIVVVVQAAGASPSATIKGTVLGLPSPGVRVFAAVRAVEAATGRIAAAKALGASPRYALRVDPGAYVVAAGVLTTRGGSRRTTSHLVLARTGRMARGDLRLPSSSSVSAGRLGTRGSVVGVGDISVGTYPVESYVIGQTLGPLQAGGYRVVDETTGVRTAIRRELRASANGRREPFKSRPLEPQFRIVGQTGLDNGETYFELLLKDAETGELVATSGRFREAPDPQYGYGLMVFKATEVFKTKLVKALKRAEAGTGGGPRVPVSIILRTLCACGPGSAGTVTASPPGLKANQNDKTARTGQGFALSAGTTVTVEAEPAAGYYLLSLSGACVYRRRGSPATRIEKLGRDRSHGGECTIVQLAEGSMYGISADANFKKCPPNPEDYPPDKFPLLREDCLGHR